jgi:prevent-host-death family protein
MRGKPSRVAPRPVGSVELRPETRVLAACGPVEFGLIWPNRTKLSGILMQSVSAHDAKARFGQLLDTARREPVVIERHGRAVAVVLSKEEYDELNDIKLQHLRAEIDLGLADLECGAYTDYAADELPKLAERIKAAGRERLAKK